MGGTRPSIFFIPARGSLASRYAKRRACGRVINSKGGNNLDSGHGCLLYFSTMLFDPAAFGGDFVGDTPTQSSGVRYIMREWYTTPAPWLDICDLCTFVL